MLETNLLKNLNDLTKLAFSCFPEKESVVTIYNPLTDPLMVNATYCPTCRKPARTYEEALFIRECGECGSCDHIRGEMLDDQRDEARADMQRVGLNPDDEDDVQSYNEMLFGRYY